MNFLFDYKQLKSKKFNASVYLTIISIFFLSSFLTISVFLYQEARRKEAVYLYEKLYLQYMLEAFNENFKASYPEGVNTANVATLYSKAFYSTDNPYMKLEDTFKSIRFIRAITRDGKVVDLTKNNLATSFLSNVSVVEAPNINNTNIESTNIESTNIESTNIESTNIESTNIESTNIESTNIESTNIESTNIESTNVESTNALTGEDINIILPPPLPQGTNSLELLEGTNQITNAITQLKKVFSKNKAITLKSDSVNLSKIIFIELFYKKHKYRIYFR